MQIEIRIVGDTATDKTFVGLLLAIGAIADGAVDVTRLSEKTVAEAPSAPAKDEEKPQPKQTTKKPTVEQQVKEALNAAEPEPVNETNETEQAKQSSYTLEAVRAEAVAISKSGKREKVVELIQKHGGEKVTDLDASVYDAFMTDLAILKKS